MASTKSSPNAVEPYLFKRFVAGLIDGLIIGFALGMAGVTSPWINFGVAYAYGVIMISQKGQTLGKMAMGIKVTSADTGKSPTMEQALKRELIKVIPFAPILLFIQMLMKQLPAHDHWAKTKVALAK